MENLHEWIHLWITTPDLRSILEQRDIEGKELEIDVLKSVHAFVPLRKSSQPYSSALGL